MKKLLVALLMVPNMAWAAAMSMPNKNGGEIVITDRVCTFNNEDFQGLRHAYSYWNGGYIEGCWLVVDEMIRIVWFRPNGGHDVRMYNFTEFKTKKGA
jgi:hypothetical protein